MVRECGRAVACPVARPLAHDPSSRPHHTVLEGAHHYASNLLLALLKDDAKVRHCLSAPRGTHIPINTPLRPVSLRRAQLIERLEVLRRVFLFGQGDLFVHFLDLSEELMDKPISSADFTRLNQLLQRALGACSVAIEPFEVRFATQRAHAATPAHSSSTPVPLTSRRS